MNISENTISEAWFAACRDCAENGETYTIDRGSFEGHARIQLRSLSVEIVKPWIRPLGIDHRGQQISRDDDIHEYFILYLISDKLSENETYTYGSRIAPHLQTVADMLRKTPGTNQATIEVGRPEDIQLEDPPCLRVLSWKHSRGQVHLSSFWRSWDLVRGFPTNIGGLTLLNIMIAEWAGLKPGRLYCYSDGAHIYDYDFGLFME